MEGQPQSRTVLAQEKLRLEQMVLDMVTRADAMLVKSVDSLVSLDRELAYEAMAEDDAIDVIDLEIESVCLKLLALQQPMAGDLREIGTILKIITDIERIGDLSVDLAKIALKIDKEMGRSDVVDLRRITNVARKMLHESVQAFIQKSTEKLPDVVRLEEEADSLYRDMRDQVHHYMVENPDQVVSASWLLIAVHHIERVADHGLNIAERVGFMVTGELNQLSARFED